MLVSILFVITSASAAPEGFEKASALIIERADRIASSPLATVLDKTGCAPNGDKQEYFSLAPYWWPNSDSEDGVPYERRDGKVNPEANTGRFDRQSYFQMRDAIVYSTLAWRIDGERRYAETAARWAKAWFIDDDTRMRPRFQFAQFVPGKNEGRPEGIIRGQSLLDVHAALDVLKDSGAWGKQEHRAWGAWLSEYTDWLRDSDMGQRESRAFNNHGSWYDVILD